MITKEELIKKIKRFARYSIGKESYIFAKKIVEKIDNKEIKNKKDIIIILDYIERLDKHARQ